jgi:maleate isomerase
VTGASLYGLVLRIIVKADLGRVNRTFGEGSLSSSTVRQLEGTLENEPNLGDYRVVDWKIFNKLTARKRNIMDFSVCRFGIILLSVNAVVEREFRKVLPENFDILATRIKTLYSDAETFSRSMESAIDAGDLLRDSHVDVVNLACTSGTSLRGIDGERKLSDAISSRANAPCITTAQALIRGLKELNLKRISVATPYIKDVYEGEKKFIESNGIEVVNITGLPALDAWGIASQPPETAYSLAKKVDSPVSDGIFVSCAALRSIEVIEKLESELGKPVFSSNIAAMWAMLKEMKFEGTINNYGSLLRTLAL